MRKKNNDIVESLNSYDTYEEGFIEGDFNAGKAIATFSFGAGEEEQVSSNAAAPTININKPASATAFSKLSFRTSQRGLTPAVDGELYTVKRCYQFRPSTIRKLNELKAKHSDYNAYLNTIIDEAISYYYDHVFSNTSN